jgi:thioredoxin 1
MIEVAYIQDQAEFDTLVANTALLVVDFTATWCGPCKLVGPLMNQLAEDYTDQISVFKVDLDKLPALAKQFSVKSIPAVLCFQQGKLVESIVGVRPYEHFRVMVDRNLSINAAQN